ncbi:hypothetical protein OPIT5_05070 [Opitutaceae bacterium TAV5]|nr:hypothetical protein OPIT5_05070 [Opitutaceae bacterium TAV5]
MSRILQKLKLVVMNLILFSFKEMKNRLLNVYAMHGIAGWNGLS